MGKLKERQTTTIHAELISWRRVCNMYFQGIVWNSYDEEYPDGTQLNLIQFQNIWYYPELKHFWEEHYVCKTFSGLYFACYTKHEVPVR